MERKEAVALIKDMAMGDLGEPSWVVLQETTIGDYLIQISSNYNSKAIENYMNKNQIVFEEDTNNRYLVISKRQTTE